MYDLSRPLLAFNFRVLQCNIIYSYNAISIKVEYSQLTDLDEQQKSPVQLPRFLNGKLFQGTGQKKNRSLVISSKHVKEALALCAFAFISFHI